MSPNTEIRSELKVTALIGWGALFWMAIWIAPYLYALSNLIQWR